MACNIKTARTLSVLNMELGCSAPHPPNLGGLYTVVQTPQPPNLGGL